jgi:hypothetical protein
VAIVARKIGIMGTLALFERRTILIGDKSAVLEPDRRIANAAETQLTCKPPQLGLGDDPEDRTEEAPRAANASANHGANRPGGDSSEAIAGWQGIRPGIIRSMTACQFGKPIIGERCCHLPSPSRLGAAYWKIGPKA